MTRSDPWPHLLLHQVPGLTPKVLQRSHQFSNNPDWLLRQGLAFWQGQVGLSAAGCQSILAWQRHPPSAAITLAARTDLAWQAAAPNHHILPTDHPLYPPQLTLLHDPPNLLFVKGTPELLHRPQIAVVGARLASETGLQIARQLARDLSAQGWVITSGLALGIDGAAHQGALDAGGPTLAVLGSGLLALYPSAHQTLAGQIASQGALVSEFSVTTRPRPYHFPQRNRIIAGLCTGLIVVEAADKSGSLITAQMALESGKEVFAVPGNPLNPLTLGCHRLIQQGAGLVTDAIDVQHGLDQWPDPAHRPASLQRPPVTDSPLSDAEHTLLQLVSFDGSSFDAIEASTGMETDVLMRLLLSLELSGHLVSQPGGFCRLH